MTYVTVPIGAEDLKSFDERIASAKSAGAEAVELRLDYLEDLNAESAKELVGQVKAASLPVIATCRDKSQGGVGDWDDDLRTAVLVNAVEAGADFVDCEYQNFVKSKIAEPIKAVLEKSDTRLILSEHNFKGRFGNLIELYNDIRFAYEGCVPKLVYTAKHINDCFEVFDLLKNKTGDCIAFAMGEVGIISRIIAKKLGSLVTFASLDSGSETAPGQVTINDFKNLYRSDIIGDDTRIYGIIGNPVSHSMSPAVHNASFAAGRLNKIYLPILIEGGRKEFNEFMANVLHRSRLGFSGFSVTIPHKGHALEYLLEMGEYVEELAERIGAVNTIVVGVNGRFSGYNTDYAGAMDVIKNAMGRRKHDLHKLKVAVIGAGGAGRAIVAGLCDVAAKVTVYNRTVSKAEGLAEEFNCSYSGLEGLQNLDADLIVNCTSIGMSPDVDASPVLAGAIKKEMTVFDTVYNPVETLLLKQAKEAGAKTIDGVSMFIGQAMAQFKLFTSTDGNAELMRKKICEFL